MTDIIPPVQYGIWMPRQGWLRAAHPASGTKLPVQFSDLRLAWNVARRMRQWARPEPIDESLVNLEQELLKNEIIPPGMALREKGKTLWHTLKTFFKHR